jgi:DNA-binding GntR family transcriptional regulator
VAELADLEALSAESGDGTTVAEAANAFHHSIRDGADNVFLNRFLDTLAPFDRTIRVRSTLDPDEAGVDSQEHRAMVDAIVSGDGDTAERVMHEHIHRVIAFNARCERAARAKRRSARAG